MPPRFVAHGIYFVRFRSINYQIVSRSGSSNPLEGMLDAGIEVAGKAIGALLDPFDRDRDEVHQSQGIQTRRFIPEFGPNSRTFALRFERL